MSKSPTAKDALPLDARMGKKAGAIRPPVAPATAWPPLPRWIPGLRGPIEVVRPIKVEADFLIEDGSPEKETESVEGKFLYPDRRILIVATAPRPAAWKALWTQTYVSRLNDLGLDNLIEVRLRDSLTEALARMHIRSWRREGNTVRLPAFAPAFSYPPLPKLVYEYGKWIRVDRPTGPPPGKDDLDETYGTAEHLVGRIWVRRNLPRPQAWHTYWHERYEARLYESTLVKLLDEDEKEAICDGLATARIVEAQTLHTWAEHPETHPLAWPAPPVKTTRRRG